MMHDNGAMVYTTDVVKVHLKMDLPDRTAGMTWIFSTIPLSATIQLQILPF